MYDERITSVKIVKKNGKSKKITEPYFGSLKVEQRGDRTVVIVQKWFDTTEIYVSSEDECQVNIY